MFLPPTHPRHRRRRLDIFWPEPLRSLFQNNCIKEALTVLARIHAKGNQSAPVIQSELKEIRVIVEFG